MKSKNQNEKRNEQIYCRVSQDEKEKINLECQKLGLTLSQYIRLKLGIKE